MAKMQRHDVTTYGATGLGVVDDHAKFEDAITAATNGTVYVPIGTYKLSDDVTVGATVCMQFEHGAIVAPIFNKTLTINGKLKAGLSKIVTLPDGVTNGTFASDSGWGTHTSWTISGSKATKTVGDTNVLTQATTAGVTGRRYLVGYTVGDQTNVCTNGSFGDGSHWTTTTGWAIGTGQAAHTSGTTAMTHDLTVTAGRKYTVKYSITAFTMHTTSRRTLTMSIGGTAGTARDHIGTYIETLTATNTDPLTFTPTTSCAVTIDDVEVYEGTVTPSIGGVSGTERGKGGSYVDYIAATGAGALTFTPDTGFAGSVSAVTVYDLSVLALDGNAVSTYHPEWFGAVTDGVTDDTLPLQAAINLCGASGGGIVKIPISTTSVATTLIRSVKMIDQGITLDGGDVRKTIISVTAASGRSGIISSASLCNIKNLTLISDGTKIDHTGSTGILYTKGGAASISRSVFENLFIQNFNMGVDVIYPLSIKFYNVTIDSTVTCIELWKGSSQNGVTTAIEYCYLTSSTYGIYTFTVTASIAEQCIFEDDVIGIYLDNASNFTLMENYFESSSLYDLATYDAKPIILNTRGVSAVGNNIVWYNEAAATRYQGTIAQQVISGFRNISAYTINGAVAALTYAATISANMALGNVFTTTTVHATGDATINATGGTAGQEAIFIITNDATSGKTITFGTNFKPNGTITGVVSKSVAVKFVYDGSNWYEISRQDGGV